MEAGNSSVGRNKKTQCVDIPTLDSGVPKPSREQSRVGKGGKRTHILNSPGTYESYSSAYLLGTPGWGNDSIDAYRDAATGQCSTSINDDGDDDGDWCTSPTRRLLGDSFDGASASPYPDYLQDDIQIRGGGDFSKKDEKRKWGKGKKKQKGKGKTSGKDMVQRSTSVKIKNLNIQVNEVKQVAGENLEKLRDREEKVEDLVERAEHLQKAAEQLCKTTDNMPKGCWSALRRCIRRNCCCCCFSY